MNPIRKLANKLARLRIGAFRIKFNYSGKWNVKKLRTPDNTK